MRRNRNSLFAYISLCYFAMIIDLKYPFLVKLLTHRAGFVFGGNTVIDLQVIVWKAFDLSRHFKAFTKNIENSKQLRWDYAWYFHVDLNFYQNGNDTEKEISGLLRLYHSISSQTISKSFWSYTLPCPKK